MRLTYIGAGVGAGVGVGIGATTRRCNCLIISGRCAGCHLRSPFRLERAHACEGRALRANRRTLKEAVCTALVVSHLTN